MIGAARAGRERDVADERLDRLEPAGRIGQGDVAPGLDVDGTADEPPNGAGLDVGGAVEHEIPAGIDGDEGRGQYVVVEVGARGSDGEIAARIQGDAPARGADQRGIDGGKHVGIGANRAQRHVARQVAAMDDFRAGRVVEEEEADRGHVHVARSDDVEALDIGRDIADLEGAVVGDVDAAGVGLRLDEAGLGFDRVAGGADAGGRAPTTALAKMSAGVSAPPSLIDPFETRVKKPSVRRCLTTIESGD